MEVIVITLLVFFLISFILYSRKDRIAWTVKQEKIIRIMYCALLVLLVIICSVLLLFGPGISYNKSIFVSGFFWGALGGVIFLKILNRLPLDAFLAKMLMPKYLRPKQDIYYLKVEGVCARGSERFAYGRITKFQLLSNIKIISTDISPDGPFEEGYNILVLEHKSTKKNGQIRNREILVQNFFS